MVCVETGGSPKNYSYLVCLSKLGSWLVHFGSTTNQSYNLLPKLNMSFETVDAPRLELKKDISDYPPLLRQS